MAPKPVREAFWILLLAAAAIIPLSLLTQEIQDSPSGSTTAEGDSSWLLLPESLAVATPPSSIGRPDSSLPPRHPLDRFLAAMSRLDRERGKSRVRIAYFGDSMIEGDLITETLRETLQEMYGGAGVGMVPMTSQAYAFRKTIFHRFSDDWSSQSLQATVKPAERPGISGEVFFIANDRSRSAQWVRYRGVSHYPRTEYFDRARLFYGPSAQTQLAPFAVVERDGEKDTLLLNGRQPVNELLLAGERSEALRITLSAPSDMPFYGVSFDGDTGIWVDNFPSRGNSGLNLVRIPGELLERFQRYLQYDLVILHFGLNVVSADRKDYSKYQRGMEQVIRHFQAHLPGADLLVVSVSDKGTRLRGEWQTDPSIPLIVESQRLAAEATDAAFFNLHEAMGGPGTIVRWVNSRPALARSDFAHPTREGSAKLAELIRDHLLLALQQWESDAAYQAQVPQP
jgi:lysophospholipase L1-like esterase